MDEMKTIANGLQILAPHQVLVNQLIILSLPTLTVETITKGDGYLEYGVGRFEYDQYDWSSDGIAL